MPFRTAVDHLLLLVGEQPLDRVAKRISDRLPEGWQAIPRPRLGAVLIRRRRPERITKPDAERARELADSLVKDLGIEPDRLQWALSFDGDPTTRVFPTGRLYLLHDLGDGKVVDAVRTALKQAKLAADIETQEIEAGKRPERARSFRRRGAELRRMVKDREIDPRTLEVNELLRPETKERAPSRRLPGIVVTLAPADRKRILEVREILRGVDGVRAVAMDAHILGPGVRTAPLQGPPPPVLAAGDLVARNYVDRAWGLFRHHWDPPGVSAGHAGRYCPTDVYVGVFDGNFQDHIDIRYDWIGYDAADSDTDPRLPLDPPEVVPADVAYGHGTNMCAMIGGIDETPAWQVGVAPGAMIVPFRPDASQGDLIFEDAEQFLENFMEMWWQALTRMYILSWSSPWLETVSMSIALGINPVILNDIGFDDMFNSGMVNGSWGDGIFPAVACGNNVAGTSTAYLARLSSSFGVGEGDWVGDAALGNSGFGKDLLVDIGRWPMYWEGDLVFSLGPGTGGSSVSTAVVAGVAALIREASAGFIPADEVKEILKTTGRISPLHRAGADANGWHAQYGFGFLDAYKAVALGYKDRALPLQAHPLLYQPGGVRHLIIQASFPADSGDEFAGQPSGVAWSLTRQVDTQGTFWAHERTQVASNCDILFDAISPMGSIFVAGDFDGDGLDEVALQMGYWVPSPPHHMLIEKFNNAVGRWYALGQRFNPALWASGEYVWNEARPVSQVVVAAVDGVASHRLIARQGGVINAAGYDQPTDRWQPIGPADFTPPVLSVPLRRTLGTVISRSVVRIEPFIRLGNQDTLLVIGVVRIRLGWLERNCLTASVLQYDAVNATWTNVALDTMGTTHIFVGWHSSTALRDVLVGDFDGDTEREAVLHVETGSGTRLYLLDCHRPAGAMTFDGHALYDRTVTLAAPLTGLKHGPMAPRVPPQDMLAYLSQQTGGNVVRSLRWNSLTRQWDSPIPPLAHGRLANEAIDLLVGDFDGDQVAEVGMLMDKPHQNTFEVFQLRFDANLTPIWEPRGFW